MATYQQLKAEIDRLTQEAEKLRAQEKAKALETIRAQIREYGVTIEDVRDVLVASNAAHSTRTRQAGKVRPKYRHPQTGKTWTGRGRAPVWMAEALEKGASKEDFLIEP